MIQIPELENDNQNRRASQSTWIWDSELNREEIPRGGRKNETLLSFSW